MESLNGAHEKFFERIAEIQLSGQPYVIGYIVETLIEAPKTLRETNKWDF